MTTGLDFALPPKELKHLRGVPGSPRVRLRRTQSFYWKVVAALLGAGFIAGLYFGILQANWHVFWLKPGWDGLFHQAWWPTYRHTAFRDIPEPAFATMGVLTLMSNEKYWDKPVSTLRVATAPFVLIFITFAVGIAGTYVLNFAFPHPVLQFHAVGNILLGVILGRILHPYWAPVGAHLQGKLLENSADRAAAKHKVPRWVRFPLAPPDLRKRFSQMYLKSRQVTGNLYDEGHPWLVIVMVVVFILVTALGLAGHYWAGTHHTIPWLMNYPKTH